MKQSITAFLPVLLRRGGLFCLFLCATCTMAHAASSPVPEVAILQIVEHEALNATRRGIEDELKAANPKTKILYESAQGNPALAAQIAQKFIGNSPDILVGIGTTATQSLMASNRQQKIPIIFSSVTDPVGAKIVTHPQSPENSISGVSNFIEPERQFELFKTLLPKLARLGVVYNPGEANSVSLLDSMSKTASRYEIKLVNAAASNSSQVADAVHSLVGKVDAIFINNDNTALSAFDSIIKIANQNQIPVFVSDTDMINKGALAALGPDQYALGRQTGKMIVYVLQQQTSAHKKMPPVAYPETVDLFLNLKAAKKLNIMIPQTVHNQAKKIIK